MKNTKLLIVLTLFIISCNNSTSSGIDNSGLTGVWKADRIDSLGNCLGVGSETCDTLTHYFDDGLENGKWNTYQLLALNADSTGSVSGIYPLNYKVEILSTGTWSTGVCDSENDLNVFVSETCIRAESFDNYFIFYHVEVSRTFVPGLSEQEISDYIDVHGELDDYSNPLHISYLTYLMINENQMALRLVDVYNSPVTYYYDRQ